MAILAVTEIAPWHWAAFVIAVFFFLALDLGIFHRQAHVVSFKEALCWTCVWFMMAMLFAWSLTFWRGREDSVNFVTGYILELSLSMDNVFVIALLFGYFQVPLERQHRVLFWGILGALIMRGAMIGAGAALIIKFHWLLYAFGAFLLFTGIKMCLSGDVDPDPERNWVIRLMRKLFPISKEFDGDKFMTVLDGRRMLTPLAIVLVSVETTDIVFAVDSIPAIFGVTQTPFVVFTSNVFAILGLRSLYFVLANAIGYFRYLKIGLSLVLVVIGAKMLLPLAQEHLGILSGFKISTYASLLIVVGIIFLSVAFSVLAGWLGKKDPKKEQ
jgi:tellurite resistance protein TerC